MLEQPIRLAYHLVLVYQLLSRRGLDEIEAAILTATALAAHRRDDVAQGVELDGVARQLVYPADIISLGIDFAALVLVLDNYRIGIDDDVATTETIAVHPIHYHSVALL